MKAKLGACIWSAAVALSIGSESATGIDLHRMWDDRCLECHGHSAAFARNSLSVSGGELQGRHHVDDLRTFMGNHYLAESEVDAVYGMLLAQASSPARFREECGGCHQSAADFARESLELRDDVLYGRSSGQAVREFLMHHRELEPQDIEYFEDVLTRVTREVRGP